IGKCLKINNTLQSLTLSMNRIHDAGIIEISNALMINTGLTHLNVGYNEYGIKGYNAINAALKVNTTLIDHRIEGEYRCREYDIHKKETSKLWYKLKNYILNKYLYAGTY